MDPDRYEHLYGPFETEEEMTAGQDEFDYELEGDLREAFRFVDLDAVGLAGYRDQLFAKGIRDRGTFFR